MTDAPQIDDRRRFKRLWTVLVFARALAGLLAGVAAVLVIEALHRGLGRGFSSQLVGIVLLGLFFALPSLAAKRGWLVVPAGIWAGAACGMLLLLVLHRMGVKNTWGAWPALATVGAAIGVVEGILEKSLATIYAGLLGGSLAGAAAAGCGDVLDAARWREPYIIPICFVLIHFGIGLSLALGRSIRDLPKRYAAGPS